MLEVQAGNMEAFNSIVLHYERSVRLFIGRYLKDSIRAEDISQEAFLRVYKDRDRYEPRAKFRTWLFTIVTRLCLNEIRGLSRQSKVFTASGGRSRGDGDGSDDFLQEVPDRDTESPADRAERRELQDVLQESIDGLPGNQRAAILLLRHHECSYQEIADALGLSPQAVKSLINRARETLRGKLSAYRDGKFQNLSRTTRKSTEQNPESRDSRWTPGGVPGVSENL